jgi:hypothetical protein
MLNKYYFSVPVESVHSLFAGKSKKSLQRSAILSILNNIQYFVIGLQVHVKKQRGYFYHLALSAESTVMDRVHEE